ncbi:DUF3221 domain-containing protein, partial [Neobacillus drentensis]|uniref:DUF3221 domain-containing protein n=1 Tax=Neobacillus drentensis TaxID=220684 RepID=UPI003002D494
VPLTVQVSGRKLGLPSYYFVYINRGDYMIRRKIVSLVMISLLVLIVGCSNNQRSDTKKSVDEKVANNKQITVKDSDEIINKNAFVEGYVSKKLSKRGFLLEVTKGHLGFDKGTLIKVGVDDEKMLDNLEEGQNVMVWYKGNFESNPPKTRGLKIEIIDSKK